MTVPHSPIESASLFTPRQRERRRGLGELAAALTRTFERHAEGAPLRSAFEESLRRVVPARSIHLREAGDRWSDRDREGIESVAFDVPVPDGIPPSVLEATFDRGSHHGDWDFQMLGLAAQMAGLLLDVERARRQLARLVMTGAPRGSRDGAAPLIGSTPPMVALRAAVERVACTDFTVLIQGESGVGKELVARQLHELSRRRTGPFVAINCAALVETLLEAELFGIEDRTATGVRGRRGKFEHADGGTLFLDEVADLSLSAQAKLLRVIQDLSVERVGGHGQRRVDIRVVAATNRSLSEMVERKLFRADLYYRLSGVDVYVPPLRERRPDILELANYFLERHRASRPLRLSPSVAEALLEYEWPGNVRELERLMERTVALAQSDVITLEDLPSAVCGDYATVLAPSLARGESLRAWAGRYARLVLDRCGGNKREACRVLSISYHTLQAYLRPPGEDTPPAAWASDGPMTAASAPSVRAGDPDDDSEVVSTE
ncbi:MAG: sigma-54 interaction domain-containing protein [Betaproteobacteria bacterium]